MKLTATQVLVFDLTEVSSSKPELAVWSGDTGKRIPFFDSCQLTITWTSNIKDVPMVLVLLSYFLRYPTQLAYAA